MAYSINTNDFPRIASYADARAHFDKVKPFRNNTCERPIGTRSHKHKNMRLLDDESIAFRLYQTDCATWHPDGSITIIGYPSTSTTSFISSLVPSAISHMQGRSDWGEPVLYLHTNQRSGDWRNYWRDALVIRCRKSSGYYGYTASGVRLDYNAKDKCWMPRDPDDLPAFDVPVIDRKAAREASRAYNLPTLNKVINAVIALTGGNGYAPQRTQGAAPMADIMEALKAEQYATAISMMPRGTKRSFGQRYGTENGILPGFLPRLRDHIYEHEGAISTVEKRILTPAQYKRYVQDSKRFG
jgi:hypothetical protein